MQHWPALGDKVMCGGCRCCLPHFILGKSERVLLLFVLKLEAQKNLDVSKLESEGRKLELPFQAVSETRFCPSGPFEGPKDMARC